MDEQKFLANRFEANRGRLRSVAYRLLGSRSEAEDAVQEAWIRLSRSDTSGVDNFGGWLTTVVSRICLDMLRARGSRREDPLEIGDGKPAADNSESPEQEALFADQVGAALLVVLEKLTPAERIAFVLHDMFDLPFDEIASIVGRSPEATRQLASRARRRVHAADTAHDHDRKRRREVVDAFLAASRGGNFDALLAILDPDVVFRADQTAVALGGAAEIRGAAGVASTFVGRAQAAQPARIDGGMGLAVVIDGELRIVLALTIVDGGITGIEAIADRERLSRLELEILAN
ncbi:MAG: sigma-70 family RNA polymerase sigma factor [Phyllobacterium sp.]|uniref:sigma-70 family RNA polymerase sigma factor n=1 Tax=Phyllobacterium sp. TaxID=1871046 RepID=UPI0030F1033E